MEEKKRKRGEEDEAPVELQRSSRQASRLADAQTSSETKSSRGVEVAEEEGNEPEAKEGEEGREEGGEGEGEEGEEEGDYDDEKITELCDRLWLASSKGNLAEVKSFFLENPGFDVNCLHEEIFEEEYADTGVPDSRALHQACFYGNLAVVRLLLAHPRVDVNVKDYHGNTPFLKACFSESISSLEVMRLLLHDDRVQVNEPGESDTALVGLAYGGNLVGIQWMIASGRELELGNAVGTAREQGHGEVVKLLEEFQAQPEQTRSEVRGALGIDDFQVAHPTLTMKEFLALLKLPDSFF